MAISPSCRRRRRRKKNMIVFQLLCLLFHLGVIQSAVIIGNNLDDNDEGGGGEGGGGGGGGVGDNCWSGGNDVVDIDHRWMMTANRTAAVAAVIDTSNKHPPMLPLHHHNNSSSNNNRHAQLQQLPQQQQQQQTSLLPELEPMRLDGLPPSIALSRHTQLPTVRLRLPFASRANLPCPVRQLGRNRTVSWMRHWNDNVQLLTVGETMYSNDNDRMSIVWRYPGNWTLNIAQVQLEDGGCYHCQVNTHPPIGLFIHLIVQGPAVTIVDERNVSVTDVVFKSGSLFRLTCLVREAERENFVLHWKFGSAVLNHDTQRGGVSVRTDRRINDAISTLLLSKASVRDNGVYTCSVDGRSEATVNVVISQQAGEEQAAVQELTGAVRCTFHHFNVILLLVFVLFFGNLI